MFDKLKLEAQALFKIHLCFLAPGTEPDRTVGGCQLQSSPEICQTPLMYQVYSMLGADMTVQGCALYLSSPVWHFSRSTCLSFPPPSTYPSSQFLQDTLKCFPFKPGDASAVSNFQDSIFNIQSSKHCNFRNVQVGLCLTRPICHFS